MVIASEARQLQHQPLSLSSFPPTASTSLLFGTSSDRINRQNQYRSDYCVPLVSPPTPSHLLSAASILTLPSFASHHQHAASGAVGIWKLLGAFCLGGIFFSTAIAAVSACYAIGLQNVRYLWDVVEAVLGAVWISFTAALSTAKSVLQGADVSTAVTTQYKSKWRQAWSVLKEELVKTRRTAAEGVAAIRQEASLYAGAVGAPGLIPLQYVLDRFLPFAIEGALEESLQQSLKSMPRTASINSIKLQTFSVGGQSPQLEAARVYELGRSAVAFDCGINWSSELEAKLIVRTVGGLARIPVVIKNVGFKGVLRVILTPLMKQAPGYGAALVSFPQTPQIGLDVRVAGGDITRIPWLRSELITSVKKSIANELLWPKRVVVPTMVKGVGGREKPLLSAAKLSELSRRDPLLIREQELAERPILRQQKEMKKPGLKALQQQFKVFVNRASRDDNPDSDEDHSESKGEFEKTEEDAPVANGKPLQYHVLSSDSSEENHLHTPQVIQQGILWKKFLGIAEN